ncbi:MAG: lipocalin family protein [Chloroflexota bacterium]
MSASRGRHVRGWIALIVVLAISAGCTGAPILARPAVAQAPAPPSSARPTHVPDPVPVVLPADDGPHDRLTEWWYYTGHLRDGAGARFGFEVVVFRAERGRFPTGWVSHFAVTDETGHRFYYAQRADIAATVDRSPRDAAGMPTGFDLALANADPFHPQTDARVAWSIAGSGGNDRLSAELTPDEAVQAEVPGGMAIDLSLSATKPVTLQDRDGWIDFGPAGGSYYYSRTAMSAHGTLDLAGRRYAVDGAAWFDHQWGDYVAIGASGWDWFAINLSDGPDLMLWPIRDAAGEYPLTYGTLVDRAGEAHHLDPSDFTVEVTDHWGSPKTGATYPAGWRVRVPGAGLSVELKPTVADQELDTRRTTGLAYWEGSQVVQAIRDGQPIGGEAYVELTGYAPVGGP